MPEEELLRKPEEKKTTRTREDVSSATSLNVAKFREYIKLRRTKLENIKIFLHLKTYHHISEKINTEEKRLENLIAVKKKAAVVRKEEPVGILPRAFFELKSLKPKSIRID